MVTATRWEYESRLRAAYWLGEPHCGAKHPPHAVCVLKPDHDGDHEGNGYDEWGPLYRRWRR